VRGNGLLLLIATASLGLQLGVCQTAFPSPAALKTTIESGRNLHQRLSCHGCHALHGGGGEVGPALDGVGSRLTRGDLETQILTPRRRQADSRMPSFAFVKPSEIRELLDFLQSLK
jgi:nitric oxide reductase subunit C